MQRDYITFIRARLISGLCPNDGHADPPPPKKDHLKKVVMNGAECSENKTGKIIKKFSDFYFSSYHRKLE